MLKNYLPSYYRNSKVMHDVLDALETEYTRLKNEVQITEDTFFVLLADKNIDRYCADLGLPQTDSDIETKRSLILARLRGTGTVTKKMLKNVANAFVNGQIEIVEFASEYIFGIKFVSKKGVISNLEGLKAIIEDIKPAHLAVDYIFTYRIWQDILNVLLNWQTVKNYTWDSLLTFEVQSNITIVGDKAYYCPDGYGNSILIWNNNKPYAREVS